MRKKTACHLSAALAVAAISGCGVSITATRVSNQTTEIKEPGIYYALPRTQIHIAVPVILEQFERGRVGAVYSKCLRACKAAPSGQPPECSLPDALSLSVLRPEIGVRGVPDLMHVYRVSVDPDPFVTVKHKIKMNEFGVVTAMESSASTVAYEVVGGLASTIVKLLGIKAIPTPPSADKAIATFPAESISCSAVAKIETDLNDLANRINAERRAIDAFLQKDRDAAFAALFIANVKERIAGVEGEIAKYRAQADLEEVKKVFRYRLEAADPLEPQEFENLGEKDLQFKDEGATDEAQAKAPKIKPFLEKSGIKVRAKIDLSGTPPSKCNTADCKIPDISGFRYRLPRMGMLSVTVDQGNEKTVLLSGLVPIAQYGPVAALPSYFEGKGGSVEFGMSDLTGGLSTVAIGSEAAPATAVTGPVDTLREAVEARRDRKEKQAQAERAAEKTDLERERDLLKLRKEIRDLKNELGN